MSQLNTKESTPAFVVTGPVRSTTRHARAQTVPLYMRVSQDERVWNSSYQLAHVMFRIGLTVVCLLRTYVSPLSLSAVSSHVLVSLLILGSV
jgi:hypothetical protein